MYKRQVHLDAEVEEVAELPATTRGAGGFGSTGVAGDAPAAKVRAISPPVPPPADLLAKFEALQASHEALLARVAALEAAK